MICAAQKVEHYEIAGYGTLIVWANTLGLDEVAEVLEQALQEEKEADDPHPGRAGPLPSRRSGPR